jgi:5-methylcytosine-specific restriction endonuclease McrA
MFKKTKIPKAIREQVWLSKIGRKFEGKCKTTWCNNKITVFDFQAGHDIPESKGGSMEVSNLLPICSRCNLSMGNQYTFKEWCNEGKVERKWITRILIMLGVCTDTKASGIPSTPSPTSQKRRQSRSHGLK